MTTFDRNALLALIPGVPHTSEAAMAELTTLRLGGPAELLVEPTTPEQVQAVLTATHRLHIPLTVIGAGSNLLCLDGGVRGVVLRIGRNLSDIRVEGERLVADAGAMLMAAARTAAENALSGLVFACGIPGTCGGGAVMNAGAYGGEMAQVVESVEGFRMDGTPFTLTNAALGFAYRESELQHMAAVVTRVTFRLTRGDRDTLLAQMRDLNRSRAEKQPILVPSAGSTFKRPKNGFAAALIDSCGLKGYRVGGASVSTKHAGFCINEGGTAADFTALMDAVRQIVLERTGVALEREVRVIGEA